MQVIHADPWGVDERALPFLGLHRTTLRRLVLRTPKRSVLRAVPLRVKDLCVDFDETHATSYNILAALLRRNLLTADWFDPSHKDSLMHPDNSKRARQAVDNIRLACCVVGSTKLVVTAGDLADALALVPAPRRAAVRDAIASQQCRCEQCRRPVPTPLMAMLRGAAGGLRGHVAHDVPKVWKVQNAGYR